MSLWKLLTARFGSDAGDYDQVRMDASTHSLQTIDYEHHEIHSNSHYFIEGFTTLGSAEVLDFCIATDDTDKLVHLVFSYESSLKMQLDFYTKTDFDADGTLIVPFGNNRTGCYNGTHTPAGSSATVMTDSGASFTIDALIGKKIYNITDGSYGIITDNDATTVTVAELVNGTDNDWDQNDQYEINSSLATFTYGNTVNSVGIRMGGSLGGSGTNPSNGTPGGAKRENEIVLGRNCKYLFRFTSGAAANDLSWNLEYYEHTDRD